MSDSPRDYILDNILPLLSKFQKQYKVWGKLPVSVVGRINLLKMICKGFSCS